MSEAQGGWPQNIAARLGRFRFLIGVFWQCQVTNQLVKGFGCAPVFFALVGRQLQGNHWYGQVERFAQTTWVVLNEFSGARRTHQHGFGRKTFKSFAGGGFEKLGGIATQITCLKGGVGHRRAFRQTLDHGEQQIGVGIALRRMQDIVHIFHGRGHTHCAHVRRSFVSPECELHDRDSFTQPGECAASEDG